MLTNNTLVGETILKYFQNEVSLICSLFRSICLGYISLTYTARSSKKCNVLYFIFFTAVPTFIRTESLSPDEKIVGGNTIDIEEVPWQVSLQYISMHICGGSIISTDYVVTAAHCTYGYLRVFGAT
jgi:hypothetical protein